MRAFTFLFFMAAGCASVDVGTTQQAQIDPGYRSWSEYSLWLDDGSLLAEILVVGGRGVDGYEANTEYWTVDKAKLRELGRQSLTITRESGDADPPNPDLVEADPPGAAEPPSPDLGMADPPEPDLGMADPPGAAEPPSPDLGRADPPGAHEMADPPGAFEGADPPGEADPPGPDLQMFTQPVFVEGGWGRGFVGDPFIGGVLLQSADGVGLRLFVDGGEISRVVWYQAIAREARAENMIPEGSFRVSSVFSIAEGMLGYAIDLAVQ